MLCVGQNRREICNTPFIIGALNKPNKKFKLNMLKSEMKFERAVMRQVRELVKMKLSQMYGKNLIHVVKYDINSTNISNILIF